MVFLHLDADSTTRGDLLPVPSVIIQCLFRNEQNLPYLKWMVPRGGAATTGDRTERERKESECFQRVDVTLCLLVKRLLGVGRANMKTSRHSHIRTQQEAADWIHQRQNLMQPAWKNKASAGEEHQSQPRDVPQHLLLQGLHAVFTLSVHTHPLPAPPQH